jgi:hypothetical protein
MVAEGFEVMDFSGLSGLRERTPPLRPTRLLMVVPRTRGVHGQRTIAGRRPPFPQSAYTRSGQRRGFSELGDQLGPDRDHANEQRNRCQRRRFFHEDLQHCSLLRMEHKENIVPILFQESRAR